MKRFYDSAISSSPHIRSQESTRTIMRDVVIALLPALIGACWFFGLRALMLAAVALVCLAGRIARRLRPEAGEGAKNVIKLIGMLICAGGALLAILG